MFEIVNLEVEFNKISLEIETCCDQILIDVPVY